MTSVEIAELTGKEHKNICRDLRELEKQGVIALLRFEQTSLDSQGKKRMTYNLPKRETLILTSGYSAAQRATIIDRWLELEEAIGKLSPIEQLLIQVQAQVENERRLKDLETRHGETQAQIRALVDGEDYFTVVGYANLVGLRLDRARTAAIGLCATKDWTVGKAPHPRLICPTPF